MKKLLKICMVFALVLSLTACGETNNDVEENDVDDEVAYTEGTYDGEGKGHIGAIKLQVKVSPNKIEDIVLVESNETSGIGDVAFEHIKANVLERQSLNVDAVTGCTFSAMGIKTALKDALGKAGADVAALEKKEFERATKDDEVIDTDIVVVGSGISGLLSAYEARKAGADVVILEKLTRNGGSTRLSSGMIVAGGTKLQEEAGIEDSVENLKNYWKERGEGNINEEMTDLAADSMNGILEELIELGVSYNSQLILQSGTATINRAHMPSGAGAELCNVLVDTLHDMGVDILTDTKALSLIQGENGDIIGLNAEDKEHKLQINAKSVIIATGGYAWNKDLLKKYSPKAADAWGTASNGSTGDGLIMAMDVNADTTFKQGYIGWKVVAPEVDHTCLASKPIHGTNNLLVNDKGNRFVNEKLDYPFVYEAMAEDGGKDFYFVLDSTDGNSVDLVNNKSDTIKALELGVELGVCYKADTLKELAEVSGLENLEETVNHFNELKNSSETEFDRDNSTIVEIKNGPFYALHAQKAILGTFGGIKTNIKGEVLGTDGNVINGLYAAGEVSNGDFFPAIYPASGSSISQCMTFGKQAGIYASEYALNK